MSADQALKKAGLHRNPHLYIVLIVLTDKVFRNANGPVIDHRLVWYVEEAHVPCIPGSMGGLADHVQGAIVDATTGRRYFSFAGRPPGLKLPASTRGIAPGAAVDEGPESPPTIGLLRARKRRPTHCVSML